MNKLSLLALAILVSPLAACTTTQFTVNSEPGQAEVVAITKDGVETKLGSTPLTLKPEDFDRMSPEVMRIGINKVGFVKEQLFIDSKWFKKAGNVNLRLTPLANWSEAYQDHNAYKYLNDVASLTAETQASTVHGDYARAEVLAKSLITRYPKLSVGWNMLGNIYYLQKRMNDALDSYEKSLNLNPENQETRNVINKIRGVASP